MSRFLLFTLVSFFLFCAPAAVKCQNKTIKFTDARQLTLIGKISQSPTYYHRIDTLAFPYIPKNVKNLATHSAGLAVSFRTNSSKILIKWCTSPRRPSSNMTGIAFEGMDLYIKRADRWQYAGVAVPKSTECSEAVVVENMAAGNKSCLLFLPTYDETISLEIGIDSGTTIEALENPFKKIIPVYGSSIVQGASASRPGMAYPARLSRETGYNFLNLGFSGNGKMEPAVADMIAMFPMDAIILDCVPNPSPQEILERTANLVKTIRNSHPRIPIIAIQSVAREKGNFDTKVAARVRLKDKYFREEIEKVQEQDPNLYLISAEDLMGNDQEGTGDGIHPNDLGFDRMLRKIKPKIMKILSRHGL